MAATKAITSLFQFERDPPISLTLEVKDSMSDILSPFEKIMVVIVLLSAFFIGVVAYFWIVEK